MAIIGNGKQLARIIVPKPLLLQTAQMIQSRLGGMVGREICHIPFSRRTNCEAGVLALYESLHTNMYNHLGIMLSTPEHILSHKLSGLQHLVDSHSNVANSRLDVARRMIKFQSWLNATCRDVLDECDVSLAVKTQLIYPSGHQLTVDGHPHRWHVAQALLSLVKDHLGDLRVKFPRSIEVIRREDGYPMVHFLRQDVEKELHERIVQDICNGRTSFLRFADTTPARDYQSIRSVLQDSDVTAKMLKKASSRFADKDSTLR